jgi:hypothetical protein
LRDVQNLGCPGLGQSFRPQLLELPRFRGVFKVHNQRIPRCRNRNMLTRL